jgi:hypothetical protein
LNRVVIVGAGPAGLAAADELAEDFDVTVIDEKPVIGGEGLRSDGKVNIHPQVGCDLTKYLPLEEAWKIIEDVEKFFKKHGMVDDGAYDEKKLEKLEIEAAKYGMKFLRYRTCHIGTDDLPKIVKKTREDLENRNVKFILNTLVTGVNVQDGKVVSIKTSDGKTIEGDYFILAPGRNGSAWIKTIVEEILSSSGISIGIRFSPLDIGVRVETSKEVLKEIVEEYGCVDPKFFIRTKTYDDLVRTFCVCHRGDVVIDPYKFTENFEVGGENKKKTGMLFGVNGIGFKHKKTENSNFSLLVTIALTKPVENTSEYGKSIVQTTNILGGRNPIILQRLGDLKRGRRSTDERIEKNPVKPTLESYTAGDISISYPYRVIQDILDALETLNKVIPGVNENSTLLYAPEVKFYAYEVETNEKFQTKIPNLFIVGDGSGHSRGINGAAATAIIAAREIKSRAY